jgi:hypothetical protein
MVQRFVASIARGARWRRGGGGAAASPQRLDRPSPVTAWPPAAAGASLVSRAPLPPLACLQRSPRPRLPRWRVRRHRVVLEDAAGDRVEGDALGLGFALEDLHALVVLDGESTAIGVVLVDAAVEWVGVVLAEHVGERVEDTDHFGEHDRHACYGGIYLLFVGEDKAYPIAIADCLLL